MSNTAERNDQHTAHVLEDTDSYVPPLDWSKIYTREALDQALRNRKTRINRAFSRVPRIHRQPQE